MSSITELLAAVGEENIKVQYIDECASGMQMTKRQGNKLTVHTDEPFGLNGMQRFGFVLWVDRDKLAGAAQQTQGTPNG